MRYPGVKSGYQSSYLAGYLIAGGNLLVILSNQILGYLYLGVIGVDQAVIGRYAGVVGRYITGVSQTIQVRLLGVEGIKRRSELGFGTIELGFQAGQLGVILSDNCLP